MMDISTKNDSGALIYLYYIVIYMLEHISMPKKQKKDMNVGCTEAIINTLQKAEYSL